MMIMYFIIILGGVMVLRTIIVNILLSRNFQNICKHSGIKNSELTMRQYDIHTHIRPYNLLIMI